MEQNQIYNSPLKNNIVNTTVGAMLGNGMISQEELPSLGVHFGFIFSREDGQIDALFQVTVTGKAFYFMIVDGKLQYASKFDDTKYVQAIEVAGKAHPCILDGSLPETRAQKARREKNNAYLRKQGITVPDKLISNRNDEETELLDAETICRRALAMFPVIQIACDIAKGNYKEGVEFFLPILEKFGVMDALNPKERRIIDGTYEMQDAIDMDWAYESFWALCWCLGLIGDREMIDGSEVCNCDKCISFVMKCDTIKDFMKKCKLRSKEEILDMLDLYYRCNWAIYEDRANSNGVSGNLNPSIVIERRRALEWVVTGGDDWYELSLRA